MIYTHTPKACKGKGAKYEGTVVINMPNYLERLKLMKECNVSFDNEDGETSVKLGSGGLDTAIALLEVTPRFIKKVSLKRKDGSRNFNSFEDMLDEPKLYKTCSEVSTLIFRGESLGEG